MSDSTDSSAPDSPQVEKPRGENYRAVIDFEKCSASHECIPVCPEKAIHEGPKRLPGTIACVCVGDPEMPDMLPGKAVVNYDKLAGPVCTGCGDCIAVCPSLAIEMVHVSEIPE